MSTHVIVSVPFSSFPIGLRPEGLTRFTGTGRRVRQWRCPHHLPQAGAVLAMTPLSFSDPLPLIPRPLGRQPQTVRRRKMRAIMLNDGEIIMFFEGVTGSPELTLRALAAVYCMRGDN
jgi:hypothetical protein